MRISDWSSDVCSSDLRLVSGDAWIDCDVAGAPLPGTVAIVPEPAPQAAQAAVASSPGKDVAAVALGVSDAVAMPVPPPVPSPESATDEASDDLAPGDMEHDVADSGIARSEEHTSELQSLMRISYAVF